MENGPPNGCPNWVFEEALVPHFNKYPVACGICKDLTLADVLQIGFMNNAQPVLPRENGKQPSECNRLINRVLAIEAGKIMHPCNHRNPTLD